jgi:hypothetical protein
MDRVSPDNKAALSGGLLFYWAENPIAALKALLHLRTKADSSPKAARNDKLQGFG